MPTRSCRPMRSRPMCARHRRRCRRSAPVLSDADLADIYAYLESRPKPQAGKDIPLLLNSAARMDQRQRIGYSRANARWPARRDDDERQRPDAARRLLQSDRPSCGVVAASPRAGRRRHQFCALSRNHPHRGARQVRHGVFGRQSRRAPGAYGGAEPLGAIYRQFRAADAALGARHPHHAYRPRGHGLDQLQRAVPRRAQIRFARLAFAAAGRAGISSPRARRTRRAISAAKNITSTASATTGRASSPASSSACGIPGTTMLLSATRKPGSSFIRTSCTTSITAASIFPCSARSTSRARRKAIR